MILPYLLRMVCLCFASFFVLNAVAALLVRMWSKSAVRFAESRAPGAAARFLLALRILPFALATLFVVGLCVPSYLWLEPAGTGERVGLLPLVLGLLGVATWTVSILRTAHSLASSARHNRLCRLAGEEIRVADESSSLVIVENDAPLLALSGLLRPRLLISRRVLHALSSEELDAALAHEQAHRHSRDNAKRFLLLFAPDIFPFVHPLRGLEHNWSRFAEWAADDEATAGDSRRALSLAAALVRVARMGALPPLAFLSTSLLAGDRDLYARVDRLLHAAPMPFRLRAPAQHRLRNASVLLAACLTALFLAPAALSSVHKLLELLLR
jgi:beta-lactamase regulating signal transducer with metallopeptidase domain